jgi:hypothetical protein
VLYLHEVHQVRGTLEEEFEEAYRDEFMPALGETSSARLLWFCHHAHGSGPAYHMVTITAVEDGAAWEALARRVQRGDLQPWARRLDELRRDVSATIFFDVEWSPSRDLRLSDVPVDGRTHPLSIYMEDTGWPHVDVDDYTAFWETGYYRPMVARGPSLLDIQAVFQTAFGSGRRKQAVLMQRITDEQGLLRLLTTETPPERKAPGQFMYEALAYRDRWESKLLRTTAWSPLH